ncbi:nucleotidyltransferase domain-containing protein [Candidatus Woesearchaeota archaeon]|nr:nucleotidyltransferase domain-containing protein [Candidatus Woesearchaeota archaeon]
MMKFLVKALKPFLKDKEIVDIIIFGSQVKGSTVVNDIDLMILSQHKEKKTAWKESLQKVLKKKVDVQIVSIEDYASFIWVTMIKEGYSVKHNMYLFERHHVQPVVLYTYALKTLTPSRKVMFQRALSQFHGIKRLSNRVILVPIQESGSFSSFLRHWEIDLDAREYALLPLMRKEEM